MGAWGEFEKELERRINRAKNNDNKNSELENNNQIIDQSKSILPHRVTFS